MTPTACPSCGSGMERRAYARKPSGELDLDICFACHAIWFDRFESVALAAASVMKLFGDIHEHRDQPPRPLAATCRCPRCRKPLAHTHDMQRAVRITYYRCADGHGRLSTFFQFLQEKAFVRTLKPWEVEKLRAEVKQVRCSSCGGPVSLAADAACPYCRAPISILDADAVRKTLAELEAGRAHEARAPDPGAAIDAMIARQRFERRMAAIEGRASAGSDGHVDLVVAALGSIMSLIQGEIS
ncbi:MAG TPA: zf-TFIIB domain-containing protein [Usitatibacter sp.]|nr:zf-TFIIB domain-containing protein [Usitatibacter sp.]